MLLRRQPSHVSDEPLPAGRELTAQGLVAQPGTEPHGVDTPRPQAYPGHAVFGEVAQGGGGGGEGAVRGAVHGAHAAPGGALAGAQIGAGVAGQVGLVDGHGRESEPGGHGHAPHPEDERTREVDEFGAVPGERGGEPSAGQGYADLRIAGQGEGGDAHHGAGCSGVRGIVGGVRGIVGGGGRRPGRGRGDDEGLVAAGDEVSCGLQGAVGHTVDVGREGLGDDDDTHNRVVAPPGVTLPTWIFRPGERPVSV